MHGWWEGKLVPSLECSSPGQKVSYSPWHPSAQSHTWHLVTQLIFVEQMEGGLQYK